MYKYGRIYAHSEKNKGPSEKSFTIIWKIENSKYLYEAGETLQSPAVIVDAMERTSWRILLKREMPYGRIFVTIKREAEDGGPKKFDLNYDFDINCDEEDEIYTKPNSREFCKGESGTFVLLYTAESEGNSVICPQNTTIRCLMKKNNGPISVSGHCVARTRIGGKYFQFAGKMKGISSRRPDAKRTLKLVSSSTKERLMTVDLCLRHETAPYFQIEITPAVEKSKCEYNVRYNILNCSDRERDYKYWCKFRLQEVETMGLGLQSYLLKNAKSYLPNDTLEVWCEITIQTGIESEEVESIEYETTSAESGDQNVRSSQKVETSVPPSEKSFSSFGYGSRYYGQTQKATVAPSKQINKSSNPYPNALDALVELYKKGILCDTKLQTATEAFPAHKVILSARSPVFEAMFTSDMKEKIGECVRIDDVDAETVKRMLLFLYSDFLEKMEWSKAKKLYFAADKYQILSLKYECTVILKRSIDLSNCCELLLMADMHQDEDLKTAVQNFIARCDKEVFKSVLWRDMERSHPLLAIDVFRAVHMQKN